MMTKEKARSRWNNSLYLSQRLAANLDELRSLIRSRCGSEAAERLAKSRSGIAELIVAQALEDIESGARTVEEILGLAPKRVKNSGRRAKP